MSTLISARNLYWRSSNQYKQDIVRNISFELKSHDFIILKGPAGCGKTKLLELLSRRLEPSSGEIIYKGRNTSELSRREADSIKANIGFIPEVPVLLNSEDLYQNLEYILKLKEISGDIVFDKIMHILKLTGLMAKRNNRPEELSSTEKKMFVLSAALAREVEIMLCDFNLHGLKEEEEIIRLLKNASLRGAGVIVTAGETVDSALLGKNQVEMINGRIK